MKRLFKVLDTEIIQDAQRSDGVKPENFVGRIEFKNVTFSYPTRKDEVIFEDLNLVIEPGLKYGFAGESGCGKSSIF